MTLKRKNKNLLLMTLIIGAMLGVPSTARAANTTWTGEAGTSDWFTAENWDTESLPTSSDATFLDTTTTVLISSSAAQTDNLTIGTTTDTNLLINGGTLTSSSGNSYIADQEGVSSTVTVTGSSSSWTGSYYFYVGYYGDGTLIISDGGSVSNVTSRIGTYSSSVSSVTVTGSDSSWVNSSYMNIGRLGTGNLTISDGGTVSYTWAYFGDDTDAVANILVTGTGSQLLGSEWVNIGNYGTGNLTVSDGGTVSNQYNITLAQEAGSSATVLVTGAGSSLTSEMVFYVGRGGTASLTILDAGSVSVTTLYVGGYSTGIGSIIVSGTSSLFECDGNAYVGNNGEGILQILNGGKVTVGSSLAVGNSLDGSGTILVSGTGSRLIVSSSLNVANGWNGGATATLTISDGGYVSTSSASFGGTSDSIAYAYVSGESSTLSASSALTVGSSGTATLTVYGGATVSDDYAYIGNNSGSNGFVTITGSGTSWINTNQLIIGRNGTGSLTISDGGYVSNTYVSIGAELGASGSVTVSGSGTQWISSNYIRIGDTGDGELIISDGAYVECTISRIAYDTGSEGTVVITGEGSSLVNTSTVYDGGLYVGRRGDGVLTVSNGGLVSVIDNVAIATISGSTGTLNIGSASGETAVAPGTISAASLTFGDGTGTLVFNHTSSSYTFGIAMSSGSGTAAILVESGFTTLTADSSSFTGTTTVSGGTLSVNGSLGGTITVTSGGRLQGTGTMSTVVIESGGVFAPGNSVGTTTVASLTLESGSSLEIEIDGTGSDVINVTGTLTNNGGDVVITMDEDVSLSTSSSYNYLTYASLSGSSVSVTVEDSLPFLTTTASSTGTTTSVAFSRNATSFASLAQTDNQSKVASVLSGLTSGDLYQGLISVKNADLARAAYDQLSGALHANVKLSLLADNKDEIFASRLEEAPSPYVQALGQWTRRDGHSQTSGFSGNSRGILIGQERQIDKDKIFGFAVHYQKANYEEEANLYADATVKSYGASIYGQMPYKYDAQLKAGLSYSYHDIESHREISISGYTDNPTGDYEAHKLESFIEAAKPYAWGSKGNIEPYGRLNLSYITIPGFKETGGEAALDMQQSKDAMGKTAIGLRFKGELPFEKNKNNKAIFKANLGWEHIVGDLTTSSTGHLATLEDASISAAPLARDSVALGAQMQLHYGQSLNLGLRYSGTLAASSASHALVGSVGYRF